MQPARDEKVLPGTPSVSKVRPVFDPFLDTVDRMVTPDRKCWVHGVIPVPV